MASMSRSAPCADPKKSSTTPNCARTTSSFRSKERAASSPRRLAAPSMCMALRKSLPSVARRLASTTMRFSRSWALARARSTACARAAPFRKQKNARRSGPRRAQKFIRPEREWTMDEIMTERSASVLRVLLNRPAKKNAMTSSMYVTLADIFTDAAKDEQTRVVLWHGAGDSFCAGNDIADFLHNPPVPGELPQARLMDAFIAFEKPIVVAVQGAAIGGGTTMLTHCDFVYAGESAKFQMPFINLALVPEFGTSYSIPARIGYLRAAELIQLGQPFDAQRAAELGLATRVVPDQTLLATATETAQELAEKPAGALQACKRLMRQPVRPQLKQAAKLENEEYAVRLRSDDAKEAFTAFLEKRPPDFTRAKHSVTTA